MIEALVCKLDNYLTLTEEDQESLRDAIVGVEELKQGRDIIRVNERPEYVHLILEGWACRYKILPDGKRAIMSYLIPGDLCDVHIAMLDHMDHSVSTITPLRMALLSRQKIEDIFEKNNTLARAFFWSSLLEESTMREWFVNVTCRPADKRIAHIFCEMMIRYRAAGLTDQHNCIEFPLTQSELADATGITVVHTNRVLQKLRKEEMISLANKQLTIIDWERLKEFGDFDPSYLHLSEASL
ncbi:MULTISPECIES: Crp/Fnr family transcriptional regulator [Halomonadaceae]|uniref:Crp/Fnr family transcriptional regulator n=1 Tax=Halomonadaceae TaxID=28256 RepID=UPI00200F4366|nr:MULTISPECIES: Crp/Fnr family transcriptional regulator [Halomonas]